MGMSALHQLFRGAGAGAERSRFPFAAPFAPRPAGAAAQPLPMRGRTTLALLRPGRAIAAGVLALAAVLCGLSGSAHAQISRQADEDAKAEAVDPGDDELLVIGRRPAPPCIRAAAEGKQVIDYACLTQELARGSASVSSAGQAALDAAAAQARDPSRSGTFSFTATQQRMGSNFGVSATPARPPRPVYAPPMTPKPR